MRLADGSVLVVGGGRPGQSDEAGCDPHSLADAERYDAAASGEWRPDTGLPWWCSYHRAVLLRSGQVLVMGGADDAMLTAGFQNATVYDPWTRTWTATTAMVAG
ncbi:hypothetical protein [Streptomyces melanogenes]|uniref:Uncharacterized protein n=1 Tax=Streptomyces melanogenes TaxID=67326 RepID=A0ABZ1XBM2_9ACTN|nr:hypothetical protein [Streptomyces melanogenes]